MSCHRLLAVVVECGTVLALSATLSAATQYVVRPDGTGDFPTIQLAIDAALSGDEVVLADGTFRGPGNRDLDPSGKDIVVRSESGDPSSCVLDCEATEIAPQRGFYIHSGESAAMRVEGITVRNGIARPIPNRWGGGILVVDSSPTIRRCRFEECQAGWGGGMLFWNSSSLVEECEVARNHGEVNGGGVYVTLSASVEFEQMLIYENTTVGRGGALVVNDSDLRLTQSTLANNDSGIWLLNAASMTIERTIVAFQNQAAFDCASSEEIELFCCDVFGNGSEGDYVECAEGQLGQNDNFTGDPLFCGTEAAPYAIDHASPCAPAHSPCGDLVGARSADCGIILGACCNIDTGECLLTYESLCNSGGSQWDFLGSDTDCSPNPCPAAQGACCFGDGSCETRDGVSCDELGGVFLGTETGCDPNPCETVDTPVPGLPTVLRVGHLWPNPSSGSFTLDLDLPQAEPVSIRVVDVEGRLEQTLFDRTVVAGRHQLQTHLGISGEGIGRVVFLNVQAGNVHVSRKLVLLGKQ